MISASHITRKYGSVTAVNDVSFEIGEGEVVGLLGQNGAGKTTIMKMLTGFLEPTAGTISIDGHDIETDLGAAQAQIGYLAENCPLYTDMTVIAYLAYVAELKGLTEDERASALKSAISATELDEKIWEPIANLSRGYRQRVGVAQAILSTPKIVILDEPTNGLDPSQIRHMRVLIKGLARSATVILSTHIMQEVHAVCDRVLIIDGGRLTLDSGLAELQSGGGLRLVTNGAPRTIETIVGKLDMIKGFDEHATEGDAHTYVLRLDGHTPEVVAPGLARAVHDAGFDLIALYPEARDLETVFTEITTTRLRDQEAGHA